jgi:hypothetical protein
VSLNFDAGNMAAGDRGLLSLAADSERFQANIDVAVGFAASLGCTVLNALYGNTSGSSTTYPTSRSSPTSTTSPAWASRSSSSSSAGADRFGHVQIADPPGRGQPGTGDLDWGTLLDLLAASGYRGHVGLEYKLAGRPPTASAGSSGTCVPMRPSKSPSGISCWVAVRHSIVGHGCDGRQRRGFLTTGSTTSTIEIVGLGIMGSAIAANVLKCRPHRRRPSRR